MIWFIIILFVSCGITFLHLQSKKQASNEVLSEGRLRNIFRKLDGVLLDENFILHADRISSAEYRRNEELYCYVAFTIVKQIDLTVPYKVIVEKFYNNISVKKNTPVIVTPNFEYNDYKLLVEQQLVSIGASLNRKQKIVKIEDKIEPVARIEDWVDPSRSFNISVKMGNLILSFIRYEDDPGRIWGVWSRMVSWQKLMDEAEHLLSIEDIQAISLHMPKGIYYDLLAYAHYHFIDDIDSAQSKVYTATEDSELLYILENCRQISNLFQRILKTFKLADEREAKTNRGLLARLTHIISVANRTLNELFKLDEDSFLDERSLKLFNLGFYICNSKNIRQIPEVDVTNGRFDFHPSYFPDFETFKPNDYYSATKVFEQAYREDTGNYLARIFVGFCCLKESLAYNKDKYDRRDLIGLLKTLAKDFPDHPFPHLQLACAYQFHRDYDENSGEFIKDFEFEILTHLKIAFDIGRDSKFVRHFIITNIDRKYIMDQSFNYLLDPFSTVAILKENFDFSDYERRKQLYCKDIGASSYDALEFTNDFTQVRISSSTKDVNDFTFNLLFLKASVVFLDFNSTLVELDRLDLLPPKIILKRGYFSIVNGYLYLKNIHIPNLFLLESQEMVESDA